MDENISITFITELLYPEYIKNLEKKSQEKDIPAEEYSQYLKKYFTRTEIQKATNPLNFVSSQANTD